MSTCQVIILDSKAPKSGAKPIDLLVMIVLHYGRMQCKEYTQSNWMSTNHMNRKSNKCRINYYLQPLVFDFMILTICCKSWLFQTLISHGRWCSTKKENKIRDEIRDQNHILRDVVSHQNHVVAFATILKQLWVMFLECRECGKCVEDLVSGVGPLQRCCGHVTDNTCVYHVVN